MISPSMAAASPAFSSKDLPELLSLASRGLIPMFDAKRQQFCHRLLRTNQGLVSEDLSPRYTMMTLLGLRESELAGMRWPLDIRSIYSSFVRDTKDE